MKSYMILIMKSKKLKFEKPMKLMIVIFNRCDDSKVSSIEILIFVSYRVIFVLGLISSKRGGGTQYSFSEDSSVGGSSYNHGSFGFIGIDRFKQIITGLDVKNSSDMRRAAMTNLCRLNPADILDEVQNPLKSVICDCLADSDQVLAKQAFSYTAKSLSNSCVSLTKSVYISFVEHVNSQFTSRKLQPALSFKDGVTIESEFTSLLLAKFRLIRDFHQHVSKYWIRYPSESLMETVITNTLSLLSVQVSFGANATNVGKDKELGSVETLTPTHFMAFLDINALWFKTWIHGAFSRVHLLDEMAKSRTLIETTALTCCRYFKMRNQVKDPLEASDTQSTPRNVDDVTYKSKQVHFVRFVHSISIMMHLLRFRKGRELFPIKDKISGDVISVETFLLKLLQYVTNPVSMPGKVNRKVAGTDKNLDPAHLVKKLFKTLAAEELPCKECFCSKAIVEALMEPVVSWTEYAYGNTTSPSLPSRSTMVNVADILTYMVSSKAGRCFFKSVVIKTPLLGTATSSAKASQPKTVEMNPCVVLCDFTVRALRGEIRSGVFESVSSEPIIDSYVFLCRQLYNHHEEFQLMQCDQLAGVLSQSWHESLRNAELVRTPTPSGTEVNRSNKNEESSKSATNKAMLSHSGSLSVRLDSNSDELKWQNVLVDNLLNFAATPKGLQLLLRSGAIDSCAYYMLGRYSKKLQVSRCEKFGYGVLLSRISGCAAGMRALNEAGFLALFVSEIWSNIECFPDDRKIAYPYLYPTEPIDQLCMKSFNSLMNVLSTFPAVFELFYKAEFPTKADYNLRDVPENIIDLVNRLVMVSGPSKLESLFNEEQSHVFGLRLINSIFASLDSMILFQTQYKVDKVLLELQKPNFSEETAGKAAPYFLDMPLIERNHVLVRMLSIGGSNERILPTREVKKDCSDYIYPIFYSLPLPSEYLVPSTKNQSKASSNEATKFLSNTQNWEHDTKWLKKCAEILLNTIASKQHIRGSHMAELLQRALGARIKTNPDLLSKTNSKSGNDFDINAPSNSAVKLSSVEDLGIQMLSSYSSLLKLFAVDQKETESSMSLTLKQVRNYLSKTSENLRKKGDQSKQQVSTSKFAGSENYPTMDWFAAVLHLMFGSDAKRCCSFLSQYASTKESICIWPARGFMFRSCAINSETLSIELEPLMYIVGNNLELIVEKELPNVSSAFRMSGYSPALVAQHWMRQCFLNILNWPDIVNYILLSVVCGVDFGIYFTVAILKHLSQDILFNSQQQTLLVFLKDLPIVGFKTSDYVEFMKSLSAKYSKLIFKDLDNVYKS